MATEFVQLNLRTEEAKKEAAAAIVAGVREIFQDKILPEAEQRSPKSEKLKPGETIHNADSIKVRTRKLKNGVRASIFTTSGHGGFLEKGTSKAAAEPYLYPAVIKYLGSVPGTIKEKFKLVPSSKKK